MNQYKLCKLLKKRSVSSVNNMYHILFYHWVYNDHVYWDKQQWEYMATGILMASYFSCRPVLMFNTRIKFENDNNDAHEAVHRLKNADSSEEYDDDSADSNTSNNTNWDNEHTTLINFDSKLNHNSDANMCSDEENDINSNSDTDDKVNTDLNNTGFLLWRHIAFIIAPHQVLEKLNILFVKVTIVHTKKEDNNSQE